jgi:hypothetical protein
MRPGGPGKPHEWIRFSGSSPVGAPGLDDKGDLPNAEEEITYNGLWSGPDTDENAVSSPTPQFRSGLPDEVSASAL